MWHELTLSLHIAKEFTHKLAYTVTQRYCSGHCCELHVVMRIWELRLHRAIRTAHVQIYAWVQLHGGTASVLAYIST